MIDLISRTQFDFIMPQTKAYLQSNAQQYTGFFRYCAVGKNSGPNQAALYSDKKSKSHDSISKKRPLDLGSLRRCRLCNLQSRRWMYRQLQYDPKYDDEYNSWTSLARLVLFSLCQTKLRGEFLGSQLPFRPCSSIHRGVLDDNNTSDRRRKRSASPAVGSISNGYA